MVYLNENELSNYEQLSYEMSKCIIKDKKGSYKLNKHGEILALKRAPEGRWAFAGPHLNGQGDPLHYHIRKLCRYQSAHFVHMKSRYILWL